MRKFVTFILVIAIILVWNNAAFGCEAYDAETMKHTGNYASDCVIEWVEPTVEEPTVEEPTVKEVIVEETTEITEEPTVEEPTVEESVVEETTEITEEPVVESAKAEIKAKAEEETEKVAPAGVAEKHFVQTGLLEDYRALEDKVIYLITALLISLLAYMPFNRKKAEARRKEK